MKKLMTALLLLMLNAGVCFGAVSEDISVYLRKDVFDAKMDAFMSEIRGEFQVLNAKIDALSRRVDDNYAALSKRIDDNYNALSKRIDDNYNALSRRINDNYVSLDTRISDLRNGIYLLLVVLGIIISLPIVQKMLQNREDRKEARSQTVTLDDVQRLIVEERRKSERIASRP